MSSPLLDLSLAEQLFAVAGEEEIAELRALVAEFSADVAPRFDRLLACCNEAPDKPAGAQSLLHGLRGVVANFALSRAAEGLQQLEVDWPRLSADGRAAGLRAAEWDVQRGMKILREQYSYLA